MSRRGFLRVVRMGYGAGTRAAREVRPGPGKGAVPGEQVLTPRGRLTASFTSLTSDHD